ncbi:MAG: hypothetical protein IT353_10330 [Gemmatimonadaceae bacterium]|nr:hypothetical protein [Gemmatimonadaceae bacterium]
MSTDRVGARKPWWGRLDHFAFGAIGMALLVGVGLRAQSMRDEGPTKGDGENVGRASATPHVARALGFSAEPNRDARPTLARTLELAGISLPSDCHDDVGQHLLARYGAVFVAHDVVVPTRCLFTDAAELHAFTQRLPMQSARIGSVTVTLQPRALNALLFAVADARLNEAQISLRSSKPAQRDYADAEQFWRSRLVAALAHWTRRGKLSRADAQTLRTSAPRETVLPIRALEARGVYFGRGYHRSIFSSAAVPGASQHHALLAIDVTEYGSAATRAILARHGWYQTVAGDPAHFTYLGVGEADLPARGLERVSSDGYVYWVPQLAER